LEHLFEKLSQYAGEGIYPYHMPGHKRRSCGMLPEELYKIDITEIDGFDNLHRAEGILRMAQEEAARLYGAEESFYLVNGSTCGILSAVSAAVPSGGHILMARNCHKSAYHAAYLRHLKVSYLYPGQLEAFDILDAVTPQQVRQALEQEPDTEAVLLVSPTYEGRIADIGAIAEIVHEKGILLIVDEAHGAHLGLADGFCQNSCQAGADLVIHSVHKTLPALTQTALLHCNGGRVDRNRLKRFLRIYQTSSPSYPLMAGIENALQYAARGEEAFRYFRERYGRMLGELSKCRHLQILQGGQTRQDVGKLVMGVKQAGITGKYLYDILLGKYGLQLEMATQSFALAMFTVNDGEEAYERMTKALLEIDAGLRGRTGQGCDTHIGEAKRRKELPMGTGPGKRNWPEDGTGGSGGKAGDAIPLSDAWDREAEETDLEKSVGRYSAEFVSLYPPGVPLLVPGERITKDICQRIREDMETGLTVEGIRGREEDRGVRISVIRQNAGPAPGKKRRAGGS